MTTYQFYQARAHELRDFVIVFRIQIFLSIARLRLLFVFSLEIQTKHTALIILRCIKLYIHKHELTGDIMGWADNASLLAIPSALRSKLANTYINGITRKNNVSTSFDTEFVSAPVVWARAVVSDSSLIVPTMALFTKEMVILVFEENVGK
jgi:hypothetical protein